MVVFSIKVSNSNPATIVIGRRGTYNTQEVTFDLSYLVENYGNGTAVLMLKRSQDISAYPAVASQANNVLTWTVSDADTYYVGNGEAQLMWYVNDGLAKTIIYPMVVMRDIIGTTEDPPSGYENWIEHLVDLGEETLENAQAAEQSATNAANSAVEADNSATSAETSATTAEAAKDDAELYKNGAETAKTASETAQSNAEIAQGKAEDARASAEDSADRAEAALAEFTTPTASATTLSPDASATASYANGHFTFGIPKGNKGDPGDPGAPGVTPDFSIGTVETLQPTQQATASVTGTPEHPVLNLGIPKGEQGDPATNLVQSVNGKTGAVVLDSGDIAYESTTVEDELGTINSALSSLQSVTEIIDTASGAIASFPDGSGLPMRSLVAEINPVQDLHGYDAPWPAGGGANIYDSEYELGYYNIGDGSKGESTSWARSKNPIPCQASTTYRFIFSGQASSGSLGYVLYYDSSDNYLSSYTLLNSSTYDTGQTMTTPENCAYMKFYNHVNWFTQVQACIELSTVTGFHPYANICPISGWTGVSGQRTGFNVWDEETESGYINADGTPSSSSTALRSKNFCSCVGGQTYRFQKPSSYTTTPNICWYDADKVFIERSATSGFPLLTAPTNACYFKLSMWNYGTTYNNDISINYPSTDTSYHAYTGESISVSFGQTVYGGSDEVISGNGTSTMGMVDLGTLAWSNPVTGIFNANITGLSTAIKNKVRCSVYGYGVNDFSWNSVASYADKTINTSANAYIYIKDTSYSDATTFKNAMNGVQLCYELATPQTFTHEGQSVDTLVGQNNVFVDTGDVSVTYQASIKGYIDKVLGQ